jgi:RNA polymerase sigma factor (sigma-70 family)
VAKLRVPKTGGSPGGSNLMEHDETAPTHAASWTEAARAGSSAATFHNQFVEVFDAQFAQLFRVLDRLSGDPELAADLTQDAFVRLYRRGAMPDTPRAWLLTVAMNLLRNAKTGRSRRLRLLTITRGEAAHSDPPPAPDAAVESSESVARARATIDRLSERERRLLLLSVEGFSYREIAAAAGVRESSVGRFIARARQAFRKAYEDAFDAP